MSAFYYDSLDFTLSLDVRREMLPMNHTVLRKDLAKGLNFLQEQEGEHTGWQRDTWDFFKFYFYVIFLQFSYLWEVEG